MGESMVFLDDLQLLEGTIRLRYYVFKFQFCMRDFFVFLAICKGDLFIHKTSSSSSKRNEKVILAVKNNHRLDLVIGWIQTNLLSVG